MTDLRALYILLHLLSSWHYMAANTLPFMSAPTTELLTFNVGLGFLGPSKDNNYEYSTSVYTEHVHVHLGTLCATVPDLCTSSHEP